MTQLTQTQRQHLRRIAHDIRPTAQVGKNGLSPALVASVDLELDAHELIKVKFLGYGDERRELAEDLAGQLGASLIGVIGSIAIMFREQRDPERRVIRLPAG